MELVVNKELYQLYASSYFDKIMPELSAYLDKGIIEVCKFFELEHINKLKIYLYDNAAEYQRLFKAPYPPNGIAGCFGYEFWRLYDQSHYKRTDSGSNRMLWKSGCQSGRSRI